MARRSSRRQDRQYAFTRGAAYDFPARAESALPPRRVRDDLPFREYGDLVFPGDTVYPEYLRLPPRVPSVQYSSPFSYRQRVALLPPGVPLSRERLTIRAPARVLFCLRRKRRREVLFAVGRAGFRGSAPKRHYVWRESSSWRC